MCSSLWPAGTFQAVCCGVQGQWYGESDLFPIFSACRRLSAVQAGARLSLRRPWTLPADSPDMRRSCAPVETGPRSAQPLLTSTSFPLTANRQFYAPVLREPSSTLTRCLATPAAHKPDLLCIRGRYAAFVLLRSSYSADREQPSEPHPGSFADGSGG